MTSPREATELPDFGDIPDPVSAGSERPPVSTAVHLDSDAPPRPKTRQRRLLAVALSLVWVAAHLGVYGIRPDLPSLPWSYLLAQVALPLALALGSLIVATSAGRLGLGVSAGLLMTLTLLAPLSFWLVATGASPPRVGAAGSDSWISAFVCLDITLAWASVPMLCAALSLRRAFPAASSWRSGLVGAACGLFAGGIINLHCANVDRFHLLTGHGIPVLTAVVLGAVLMQRLTRS